MRKKIFTFLLALASSVGMSYADSGDVLSGAFTINSDGDQISFSKGNLQYTKSTGKWKIMDHQYDMVETSSQDVGTDYASQDVVSLFGWGTSGWDNTAADATSVHYQPYSTCNTNHSTTNNGYQYGPSMANVANGESWSKSSSYENYDWGVFNSSDLGAGWRTLTKEEWEYLFNTRTPENSVNGVSNARYTVATINTDGTHVNGIILFPDDANLTTVDGVIWSTINGSSDYETKCTSAGWTALQNVGCVFIPAAGYRDGTSVNEVGSEGYYWSSSAYYATSAYFLFFSSGSVSPQNRYNRCDGYSVRLVTTYVASAPANPSVGMKGSWDNWADQVNFTDNGDGTASATLDMSTMGEGYYTFKTVLDDTDWRGNGYTYKRSYTGAEGITENGGDMTFWMDAKGVYTFTWTYATNAINITFPALPTIQTKGSWDNWADELNFTDNGDGTASVTKNFATEGYFTFKINVGADDWRGNGELFKRDYTSAQWINDNGADMTLYIDEPGDYTFTWTYVENTLTITLPTATNKVVTTNADPVASTYYYSTFYHSTNKYALTNDGTEAFIANLSGDALVLTKIAEGTQVIPANTAVIFRKSGSADAVVLSPTEESAVSVNPENNVLRGVDVATNVTDIAGLNAGNCYVLSGGSYDETVTGVGFYRIYGSTLL
ncbi:MAG: hypothetical protein IJQ18_03435, partial [Paludibacteraceae bacterium]|nr:hypothetical protein [Paludibacteraceae bacterium]